MTLINISKPIFVNKKLYSKNLKYNLLLNQVIKIKLNNYFNKLSLTTYDKLFYYYNIKNKIPLFTHKAFIAFELQINSVLVRTKLIPYLHIAEHLCYYRLIQINNKYISNYHYILNIYDLIQLPVFLYHQFYYKQYQIQILPLTIKKFFQVYWKHTTNFSLNKIWLLNNFVTSNITAQSIIFEYPNINIYQRPFRRFTKLYYQNHPYSGQGAERYLANTYSVLKLKIFEYAQFYK